MSIYPLHREVSLTTCRVNALYYVTFTTAVLVASFILFQGFNTTDVVNTVSLISGFVVIFIGVLLLDMTRQDPTGQAFSGDRGEGLPTDGLSAIQTRYSMQSHRSFEGHRRSVSNGSIGFSPRSPRGDREGLMHHWDAEQNGFGLADLTEDSEGERANGKPDAMVNGDHARKPE